MPVQPPPEAEGFWMRELLAEFPDAMYDAIGWPTSLDERVAKVYEMTERPLDFGDFFSGEGGFYAAMVSMSYFGNKQDILYGPEQDMLTPEGMGRAFLTVLQIKR